MAADTTLKLIVAVAGVDSWVPAHSKTTFHPLVGLNHRTRRQMVRNFSTSPVIAPCVALHWECGKRFPSGDFILFTDSSGAKTNTNLLQFSTHTWITQQRSYVFIPFSPRLCGQRFRLHWLRLSCTFSIGWINNKHSPENSISTRNNYGLIWFHAEIDQWCSTRLAPA